MTRGLHRSTGKRLALLITLLIACAGGCGQDRASGVGSAGRGGQSGEGGDDASIEDASDGDAAIDEQTGGTGGAGAGSGSGGGGAGGDSGAGGESGEGGEGGDGGEPPTLDGGDEGDAGPQDAVCFAGGAESDSSATGACADPIVIDMSALDYGDSVFHRTGTAETNGLVPSLDKCAEGTGRDVVFNVKTSGTADLEVSVDAADGSDPIILVQDGPDPECNKSAATVCLDDTGAGDCEYLRVRLSAGGYDENTPQVVIAETVPSGVALIVRFRLIDPGSGS